MMPAPYHVHSAAAGSEVAARASSRAEARSTGERSPRNTTTAATTEGLLFRYKRPASAGQQMGKPPAIIARRKDGRPPAGPPARRPISNRRICVQQVEAAKLATSSKIGTGKYNMNALRKIASTEEISLKELAKMYEVENDDQLPVNLDIYQLLNLPEGERRPFLSDMLKGCPDGGASVATFTDTFLERLQGLSLHF